MRNVSNQSNFNLSASSEDLTFAISHNQIYTFNASNLRFAYSYLKTLPSHLRYKIHRNRDRVVVIGANSNSSFTSNYNNTDYSIYVMRYRYNYLQSIANFTLTNTR